MGVTESLTLWLQISVNKSHEVKVFQRCRNLGRIESCGIFINTFVWSSLKCYVGQLSSVFFDYFQTNL